MAYYVDIPEVGRIDIEKVSYVSTLRSDDYFNFIVDGVTLREYGVEARDWLITRIDQLEATNR